MRFLLVGLVVSLGFFAVSCDQHSWEDEKDDQGNIIYKGTKRFYTDHHGDSHDTHGEGHEGGHGDDHADGHSTEVSNDSHDEGHKKDDKGHH